MFSRSIKLFTLFGFEVKIDFSWLFLAILIAWSLSAGYFPMRVQELSRGEYWAMGIIGAIGLFLSIIVHEFSHSLVARAYGVRMKGITLFLLGGVAEMTEEPSRPWAEFAMAAAGPLSSFLIAGGFYAIYWSVSGPDLTAATAVILYLAWINAILGIFNLIPAFPLDGGRLLRAILWKIKRDVNWATKISSYIGAAFGYFLILIGLWGFLTGGLIGGLWWVLIGFFVQAAARSSYQRLVILKALRGEKVEKFMKKEPVTVRSSTSLKELVDNYLYRYDYKIYPVLEDGDRLIGCVSTKEVKEVPRERWETKQVGEIAASCPIDMTIRSDQDATEALSYMNKTGLSRLMVVDGKSLIGVITLKDLLQFLSMKVELERQ